MTLAAWVVMPYLNNETYTSNAVADVLAQTVPDVQLLLIDQGSRAPNFGRVQAQQDRVHLWRHDPPLPSLAATWNRALQFVWDVGGTSALVINNDVRLAPWTYELLLEVQDRSAAWFVSAVSVTQPQFEQYQAGGVDAARAALGTVTESRKDGIRPEGYSYGGPDFSCYLITKACHDQYPFDPNFIPCYTEDVDIHRRLLLDGNGQRIFGVNIPFLHFGSATLKQADPATREQLEQRISAGSRAYYAKKWGGPCNAERFRLPFNTGSDQDGVTTPELQQKANRG